MLPTCGGLLVQCETDNLFVILSVLTLINVTAFYVISHGDELFGRRLPGAAVVVVVLPAFLQCPISGYNRHRRSLPPYTARWKRYAMISRLIATPAALPGAAVVMAVLAAFLHSDVVGNRRHMRSASSARDCCSVALGR